MQKQTDSGEVIILSLSSYFYTVFHLSQWGKHKKKNILLSFDKLFDFI